MRTAAAATFVAVLGHTNIGITDIVLAAGVLGYLVDRVIDSRGWSRSSKTLRRENEDLVRRNGELEQTVERHEETIADQKTRLDMLEGKVRDLERNDLAAVLRAIEAHESSAERRAVAAVARIQADREASAARHLEHVRLLSEIRDRFPNPGGAS